MKKTTDKKAIATTSQVLEGIPVINSPEFYKSFKRNPLKIFSEVLIGLGSSDRKGLLKSGARIIQAVRTGNITEQLAKEMEKLQKEGKIDDEKEYASRKNVAKSFVDLLNLIDGNPDEDKLTAAKTLFLLMLSPEEIDKNLCYQLFQIVLDLSSSELLTLKACYSIHKREWPEFKASATLMVDMWLKLVSEECGHSIRSLIEKDEKKLENLILISERKSSDRSGIDSRNFRLTDLGIALCEFLESGKKIFFENVIVKEISPPIATSSDTLPR